LTNKEFAVKDSSFQQKCSSVGIEPTRRQASKFRNRKGRVYKYFNKGLK